MRLFLRAMELIGVRRGEDRITLRLSADRDPFLGNLQLTIQACAKRMHFCFHSFTSVASSFGEVLKTEAVLPCSSTAWLFAFYRWIGITRSFHSLVIPLDWCPATDNTGMREAHALLFSFLHLSSKLLRRSPQNRSRTALQQYGLYCQVRRERDSNPRSSCPDNGFRDRPNRPLWHLSGQAVPNGHSGSKYNPNSSDSFLIPENLMQG